MLEEELQVTLTSAMKRIANTIDIEIGGILTEQLIKGRIEPFGQWHSNQLSSLYNETKISKENYDELKELIGEKCELLERLRIDNRGEFERINKLEVEVLV